MRIGIITFHDANNYGAALQAYALQTVLRQQGHDAVIIDYTSDYMKHPFGFENFKQKGIVAEAFTFAGELSRWPRKKPFAAFRKRLVLTPRMPKEELRKLSGEFDLFIAGSDQVWNYQISNFDGAYFLDFVDDPNKKGSYAASIALSSIEPEYRDRYISLLGDFRHYNVREKTGAHLLRELLDINANVVLDPTMLLTKSDWEDIAVLPKVEGDYIITYQVGMDAQLLRNARVVSNLLNCPIYSIPFPQGGFLKSHPVINAGPEEWLGWIKNARYVITDSFHGLAFSIMFEKEFLLYCSTGGASRQSRQRDLLGSLKIEERAVQGGISILPPLLNYEEINMELNKLRVDSLKHLLEMTVR